MFKKVCPTNSSIILHASLPSQHPLPWALPPPRLSIRTTTRRILPNTVFTPITSPLWLLPIEPLLLPVPRLQLIKPLVSVHRAIVKVIVPTAYEPLPQEVFPRGPTLLLSRRSGVRQVSVNVEICCRCGSGG